MAGRITIFILLACLICLFASPLSVASTETFEPMVLVYVGDMPGYGEALTEIISETGTRAKRVVSGATLLSLVNLPQTRCVVITGFTPEDFTFLRKSAGVLKKYFQEGGSLVGIGPVCSSVQVETLSADIFAVGANMTGRGANLGDIFGSTYVLDRALGDISTGMPEKFGLTQSQFYYSSGPEGIVEPAIDWGNAEVVYREETTGAPLLVASERHGGGRSIALPGLVVTGVERLPFYWERLVEQNEFRELLKNCVSWAVEGSTRYVDVDAELEREADRRAGRIEFAQDRVAGKRRLRLLTLGLAWAAGILVQAMLVTRYVIPKIRG